MIFLSFGAVIALLGSDAGVDAFGLPRPGARASGRLTAVTTAFTGDDRRRTSNHRRRAGRSTSLRAFGNFWGNGGDDPNQYYDDVPRGESGNGYGSGIFGSPQGPSYDQPASSDYYKTVMGESVNVSPDCGNILDPYGGYGGNGYGYGTTNYVSDASAAAGRADSDSTVQSLSGIAQSLSDAANALTDSVSSGLSDTVSAATDSAAAAARSASDAVTALADTAANAMSVDSAAAGGAGVVTASAARPQAYADSGGQPLMTIMEPQSVSPQAFNAPNNNLMMTDSAAMASASATQPIQTMQLPNPARILAESAPPATPSSNDMSSMMYSADQSMKERVDALTNTMVDSASSAVGQSVPSPLSPGSAAMDSASAATQSPPMPERANVFADSAPLNTPAPQAPETVGSFSDPAVAQMLPERAGAFAQSAPMNQPTPPSTIMESASQSMKDRVDALTDSMMQSGGLPPIPQGGATNALAESAAQTVTTTPPPNTATESAAQLTPNAAVESAVQSMPEATNIQPEPVAPLSTPADAATESVAQSVQERVDALTDSLAAASSSSPSVPPPTAPDAIVDSAAKSLSDAAATTTAPPAPSVPEASVKSLWESASGTFDPATSMSPFERAQSFAESPAAKSISGKASSLADSAAKTLSGKASSLKDSASKSLSEAADSAVKSASQKASSLSESAAKAVSDKAHSLSDAAAKSISDAAHSVTDSAAASLSNAAHSVSDSAARALAEAFPPPVEGAAPTFFSYIQARAPAVISFLKEKGPPAVESVKAISAAAVGEIQSIAAKGGIEAPQFSAESLARGLSDLPPFPADAFGQVARDLVHVFQMGGSFDDLIHALNVPALGAWYALPLGGVLIITMINNSIIEASYRRSKSKKGGVAAATQAKKYDAPRAMPWMDSVRPSMDAFSRPNMDPVRPSTSMDAVQPPSVDPVRYMADEVRNMRPDNMDAATEDDYSNLAAELESMKSQLERAVRVEKELRAEIAKKDKKLDELAKSSEVEERLMDELMDANIKLEATKNGMESIFRKEKGLKAELSEAKSQLDAKKKEIEGKLGVERELRSKLSEAETQLKSAKGELEKMVQSSGVEEKLRNELMDTNIQLEATKNGMESIFKKEKELKAELTEANKQLEAKKNEIEVKLSVEEELRVKLSEAESQLKITTCELEERLAVENDLKAELTETKKKLGGSMTPELTETKKPGKESKDAKETKTDLTTTAKPFFAKSTPEQKIGAEQQKIKAEDFKAAVMDAEKRERNKNGQEVVDGMLEPLAASFLSDKNDPTRLTWEVVEAGWGTWTDFMLAYGLKPSREADLKEALAISRRLKKAKSKKKLF